MLIVKKERRLDNFPWDMTAVSSNEIYGTKGTLLRGKRVLIGVTGSIAAIEVPHLIREILRYSGEPIVVLSEEARRFVTLDALTWSTGKIPFSEISGLSEHIRWSVDPDHKVDLFILCPATVNSISKLAVGIADGPVTLSALACIGAKIPLIIVPAAHRVLLDNPITEKNIDILTKLGVKFISSEEVENKYKFPSLEKLMEAVFDSINPSQNVRSPILTILVGGPVTILAPQAWRTSSDGQPASTLTPSGISMIISAVASPGSYPSTSSWN